MIHERPSDLIRKVEEEIGPLSDAQRALMITDGSVTQLLEGFCRSRISIQTVSQQVLPAGEDIVKELALSPGDEVNHRIVEICNEETGQPLIYAVSDAPVSRLPKNARLQLMKADIPIGHILRDEQMESRRELVSMRSFPGSAGLCSRFGLVEGERFLARRYRIIHQNNPIFQIDEYLPHCLFSTEKRVVIRTPSRIHVGLIDMNGSIGRVDGGVGITLDKPGLLIEAERGEGIEISSPDPRVSERISRILDGICRKTGVDTGMKIRVHETIPNHSGLGSGTQISLAVAAAAARLLGDEVRPGDLATLTGRGGTSGIGVRAFEQGGVIVDGGHRFGPAEEKETFLPSSASGGVRLAPLIGRYEFPKDWKIVLALPDCRPGASGAEEKQIFSDCCPVPEQDVESISRTILMQMIPSLLEEDLDGFGRAVTQIQKRGFKKCELDLQTPVLRDILEYMIQCGAAGAGMSSFGPALYAVTDTNCSSFASDIRSFIDDRCGGSVIVTSGRNSGAAIRST